MNTTLVDPLPVARSSPTVAVSPVVGIVHSLSADGVAYVDYPGSAHGPLPARVAGEQDAARIAPGSSVVLLFEQHDPTRPVILAPLYDRLCESSGTSGSVAEQITDAIVDGRRIVLEARHEIVLRCGRASITLTANGKVVVKGTELVSRSSGANKIKGAVVNIN
jgi:hypothetical protein